MCNVYVFVKLKAIEGEKNNILVFNTNPVGDKLIKWNVTYARTTTIIKTHWEFVKKRTSHMGVVINNSYMNYRYPPLIRC